MPAAIVQQAFYVYSYQSAAYISPTDAPSCDI